MDRGQYDCCNAHPIPPTESLSFYFHTIKQLRLLTLPGEDIAHGVVKWYRHFRKQLDILENIKHVVTT